jgi:hypothetical protein
VGTFIKLTIGRYPGVAKSTGRRGMRTWVLRYSDVDVHVKVPSR